MEIRKLRSLNCETALIFHAVNHLSKFLHGNMTRFYFQVCKSKAKSKAGRNFGINSSQKKSSNATFSTNVKTNSPIRKRLRQKDTREEPFPKEVQDSTTKKYSTRGKRVNYTEDDVPDDDHYICKCDCYISLVKLNFCKIMILLTRNQ